MKKEQKLTLEKWLMQRELEASRQSRRLDNKEPIHVLEARASAFEDASEYFADILQKATDRNGEYTTEAQAHDLQQRLKLAVMLADDVFNTSDPYYADIRTGYKTRSETLSEILEFLNSDRNQGQQ